MCQPTPQTLFARCPVSLARPRSLRPLQRDGESFLASLVASARLYGVCSGCHYNSSHFQNELPLSQEAFSSVPMIFLRVKPWQLSHHNNIATCFACAAKVTSSINAPQSFVR